MKRAIVRSAEELVESTAFHDLDLTQFSLESGTIKLCFRNIGIDTAGEVYYRAVVELYGVSQVTRNREAVLALGLEGEDAEVLQFHRGKGFAKLLVEWKYYRERRTEFAQFEIKYCSSTVTVKKQDRFIDED